ncbi:DUF4144 domain-containing protein [Pseudoalteromonas sp. C2R02]|uniref:DUF4144 domain-containing protein n=1 Tax=Pseudoalteromonas sp. C2R02 TaxID=2841565 RepID=UPI001C084A7E|nr:DUF4144 domain-containing protein [Pseudoalteromonas sp. C2R02]MBU2969178.1 DUF4144 domain-containing protein [Pseudoalteromonas sp. C2R02]
MVNYPCILKLYGDDELIYLSSKTDLSSEFESLICHDEDYLIDSTGQTYQVHQNNTNEFTFLKIGLPVSAQTLTELIQAHEFSQAQVCLTKIQFKSVTEAINSLAL